MRRKLSHRSTLYAILLNSPSLARYVLLEHLSGTHRKTMVTQSGVALAIVSRTPALMAGLGNTRPVSHGGHTLGVDVRLHGPTRKPMLRVS